jgi:hypothetical protein
MPSFSDLMSVDVRSTKNAAIALNGNLSAAVELAGCSLVGVAIYTADGWTDASIDFQVSADGSNYCTLYDVYGNRIATAIAAGRAVPLEPKDFLPWRYIKVHSCDSAGSNVTQLAARTIRLVVRPL